MSDDQPRLRKPDPPTTNPFEGEIPAELHAPILEFLEAWRYLCSAKEGHLNLRIDRSHQKPLQHRISIERGDRKTT